MTCPRCSAEVTADARFCSQCGARLEEGAEAARARRRHTRLPPRTDRQFGMVADVGEADITVEWLRDGTWTPVESVLVDVGRGGVGLVCDEQIPVGSQVRAVLEYQDQRTRAAGHVVYSAPIELFAGVPCYRCGVAFDRPQPRFVNALAGPAGGVGFLINLGDVASGQGDLVAAHRWYQESLALCHDLDDRARVPRVLESLAVLAALDGRGERALRLGGAAAKLRGELGIPATPGQHARVDGALGPVRWELSEKASAAAWSAGERMEMNQAIAYALEEI